MYVTLLSKTSKSEFPNNQPNSFKVRLAHPLKLKGWKVGLANIYLPGLQHEEKYAITSHPNTKHTLEPVKEMRQHKLYEREGNHFLFQMYGQAVKQGDSSQTKDVTATLKKADIPDAKTGVTFMNNVILWLQHKILDGTPVGYCFTSGNNQYISKFVWKEEMGEPSLWIRNNHLVLNYTKPKPYFAVNLTLAMQMGWVIAIAENTYKIGPNLLKHPYENDWKNKKLAPNTDKTSLFTFGDYLHVYQGIVYFSMTFDWQFINLNKAYEEAITHTIDPPAVWDNEFGWLMKNESVWEKVSGIAGLDYVKLEISPHIWNKKALMMWLTKQGNQYKAIWEWDMKGMALGEAWFLILESYQTDKTLFDKTSIKVTPVGHWMFLRSVYTGKYVNKQQGADMLYYHKQLIWFVNSDQRGTKAPYKLRCELSMDDVPAKYPKTLWDSIYFVVYGYQRDQEDPNLHTIRDVYDGHPPGPVEEISTSYWVFDERIADNPTNTKEKTKQATVKPSTKGNLNLKPAMIYCNVGESRMVGNQITNFVQAVPYRNEPLWWSPETIHYTTVRDDTTEIVEVEIADNSGKLLNLNPQGESQLTLHFKRA